MQTIDIADFLKIELRVGTIIKAEISEKTKNHAYKLWVNLGELGIKKSSAQITEMYKISELVGKQVICVCNFKPKQIGDFMSEILVTGFDNGSGKIVLATVESLVPNGKKLH
jgi:tRNA-binding protein